MQMLLRGLRQMLGGTAVNPPNELAALWLSATQVAARLGADFCRRGSRASQRRHDSQLLGVYVARPSPTCRYPNWRLRADGQPVDHLAEILVLLRDFGPFGRETGGLRRTTGWGKVEWFLCPHAPLDGTTPAEVLMVDSVRVFHAARIEFQSSV